MSTTPTPRSQEQIRTEIENEREQLADAVDHLRTSIDDATNLAAKVRSRLPLVAAGAASVAFVFAGGVGATMRYFARRGREKR